MQRPAFAAALAALFLPAPAHATGGFECRPIKGPGPRITLAVPHAIAAQPFQAAIHEGRRMLVANRRPGDPIVIAQSWIDRQHLWLDLVDANGNRFEARLRARFQTKIKYPVAVGTLDRGGKTYRVRCIEA